MTTTSALAVTTHRIQYVQPAKYPAHGPSMSRAKSWKDLYSRLWSKSSPMALITKKSIVPMSR